MLNERAVRRDDFLPGVPVLLANAQSWFFPLPAGGGTTATSDDDYRPLVGAVAESEDEAERLRAELALAIYLLARNYHLSPRDFRELLECRPDDPRIRAMKHSFRGLA